MRNKEALRISRDLILPVASNDGNVYEVNLSLLISKYLRRVQEVTGKYVTFYANSETISVRNYETPNDFSQSDYNSYMVKNSVDIKKDFCIKATDFNARSKK